MLFPIGDDNVKGGFRPIFCYLFLLANIAVYIMEVRMGPDLQAFIFTFGGIPAEIMRGQDLYTLFTSMFLHGGLAHLIGNMLFLWIFADNVEAIIGNRRFLIFYLLGGLAAHLLHLFFNPTSTVPTVGASGAIAAVLGAYLVMFPRSQVRVLFLIFPFYISAWLFLGIWIFMQVSSGLGSLEVSTAQSAGVAYWAHVGGFVFGFLMGFLYRNRDLKRHKRRKQEQEYV